MISRVSCITTISACQRGEANGTGGPCVPLFRPPPSNGGGWVSQVSLRGTASSPSRTGSCAGNGSFPPFTLPPPHLPSPLPNLEAFSFSLCHPPCGRLVPASPAGKPAWCRHLLLDLPPLLIPQALSVARALLAPPRQPPSIARVNGAEAARRGQGV